MHWPCRRNDAGPSPIPYATVAIGPVDTRHRCDGQVKTPRIGPSDNNAKRSLKLFSVNGDQAERRLRRSVEVLPDACRCASVYRKRSRNLRESHSLGGACMGTCCGMIARHIARILGPAVVAASGLSASALTGSVLPSAAAQCPDVQVVFARGTGEPPGVGPTGQAFVDTLRPRVGAKSFDVYPVNYPASDQWDTGLHGIRDAGAHVVSMAKDCPNTQMVLGGYSQGAAIMGFVTSAAIPDGIDPTTVPKPMDPDVANHVS